ncbi:MAG: hypothetical protein SFZ23_05755 [Planctomycetota bacterium]|nr:hypothetical protein [Planctomycetota bacterium]
MARRMLIAFVLSAMLAVGCYVIAPRAGVYLPWFVPLVAFGAIFAAAIAPLLERSPSDDAADAEDDDQREDRWRASRRDDGEDEGAGRDRPSLRLRR